MQAVCPPAAAMQSASPSCARKPGTDSSGMALTMHVHLMQNALRLGELCMPILALALAHRRQTFERHTETCALALCKRSVHGALLKCSCQLGIHQPLPFPLPTASMPACPHAYAYTPGPRYGRVVPCFPAPKWAQSMCALLPVAQEWHPQKNRQGAVTSEALLSGSAAAAACTESCQAPPDHPIPNLQDISLTMLCLASA